MTSKGRARPGLSCLLSETEMGQEIRRLHLSGGDVEKEDGNVQSTMDILRVVLAAI